MDGKIFCLSFYTLIFFTVVVSYDAYHCIFSLSFRYDINESLIFLLLFLQHCTHLNKISNGTEGKEHLC